MIFSEGHTLQPPGWPGSGTAGQLSVLQQRDRDADAVPSFGATFDGRRVIQTAGMGQRFIADDYVSVDVSKIWGLSGWARTCDNFVMRFSSSNQQSFGIEEYDADYLKIESIHVLKYGSSVDTTLRADLRPGDPQILLNSASGWSSSSVVGTRALAWCCYSNASGSMYASGPAGLATVCEFSVAHVFMDRLVRGCQIRLVGQ